MINDNTDVSMIDLWYAYAICILNNKHVHVINFSLRCHDPQISCLHARNQPPNWPAGRCEAQGGRLGQRNQRLQSYGRRRSWGFPWHFGWENHGNMEIFFCHWCTTWLQQVKAKRRCWTIVLGWTHHFCWLYWLMLGVSRLPPLAMRSSVISCFTHLIPRLCSVKSTKCPVGNTDSDSDSDSDCQRDRTAYERFTTIP